MLIGTLLAIGLASASATPMDDATASGVQHWLGRQARPCVVAMDWPAAWRLPADETVMADDLARASGGTWRRVGAIDVLTPAEAAPEPAATAPNGSSAAALRFVESLTGDQLAALVRGKPLAESSLTAAQAAALEQIWPGGADQAAATRSALPDRRQWSVRLLARPIITFSRGGRVVAEVDLLARCWNAAGYDFYRVCTQDAKGELVPFSVPERKASAPRPYRDLTEAEAVSAAGEGVVPALPIAIRGAADLREPVIVALGGLGKLLGLPDGLLLADRRVADWRLALAPGHYGGEALLTAAAQAYELTCRPVDGTLLLGPPSRTHRQPNHAGAQSRWLLDHVRDRLRPLGAASAYQGLVLPLTWFVDRRTLAYARLSDEARGFVEDVAWAAVVYDEPQTGLRPFRAVDWTAASVYADCGAGSPTSAARALVRSELAGMALQFDMGYGLERTCYQRTTSMDSWAERWRREGHDVPGPLLIAQPLLSIEFHAANYR